MSWTAAGCECRDHPPGLAHDPEKHALGPRPDGGYRFSEKIVLEQKDSGERKMIFAGLPRHRCESAGAGVSAVAGIACASWEAARRKPLRGLAQARTSRRVEGACTRLRPPRR